MKRSWLAGIGDVLLFIVCMTVVRYMHRTHDAVDQMDAMLVVGLALIFARVGEAVHYIKQRNI